MRLFSGLSFFAKTAKTPPQGRLEAIFVAPGAGAPMVSLESTQAIQGQGLKDDRYAQSQGFWKATDACQVTLISTFDLAQARRRGAPERLEKGSHRRNLVISGLRIQDLKGHDFQIGEAVFRYQKPRPPCGYLDKIEGAGLARALGKHSGICIQVVQAGLIKRGDTLTLL